MSAENTMKLSYIDLFAGCGGLSLGLHKTGRWHGLFAIEKSPDAFMTLQSNLIEKSDHFDWPDWLPQQEHDIKQMLKDHQDKLKTLRGTVDLVVGGPPCQGFSTAGKRREDDQRNTLIKSYVRFIRLVQPKIIFFENVKGFLQEFKSNKTKGKSYANYVKRALQWSGKDYHGYRVVGRLVDFSQYGIPQKRTRFILVGVRKDLVQRNISRQFFSQIDQDVCEFLVSKNLRINPNLEEAISDLLIGNDEIVCSDSERFKSGKYKEATTNYQEYMRKGVEDEVPNSHRLAKHRKETETLFQALLDNDVKGCVSSDEKKQFNVKKRSLVVLDPKKPAPTLTTHPDDFVHYSEPRIPTVRECARIQTFPDTFEFKGRYTTGGERRVKDVPRYSQVGNAIPPLFGELAGLALASLLAEVEANE